MHFTVPDICNQNGCLISVTLQKFKYRTNPNGSTLYTKTSQTLKIFIIAGTPSKVLHLIVQLLSVLYCQFVVILAWLYHIEDVVPLLVDNG